MALERGRSETIKNKHTMVGEIKSNYSSYLILGFPAR